MSELLPEIAFWLQNEKDDLQDFNPHINHFIPMYQDTEDSIYWDGEEKIQPPRNVNRNA